MQSQAYFEDIQDHLIRELKKATKSICVAVAWLTDKELFDILCEKAGIGLKVELILMDDRINRQSGLAYQKLHDLNGKVFLLGDKKRNVTVMHNKFCVIDGKTIITGSYNWSRQARKNYENIVVVKGDAALVRQFMEEFEGIKDRNFRGETTIHYGKIFSHLEALKRFIQEGDDDDVGHSLGKLKKIVPHGADFEDIRRLMELVEKAETSEAVAAIENFLRKSTQVAYYVDPEVSELRLELRSLEIQIGAMEDEKAEIERLLNEYTYRFNTELGEILREILQIRRERIRKELEADESKRTDYEEAQKDFEDFEKANEESKAHPSLRVTEEEQKELKSKFRAASKICHPDMVAEAHRKQAAEIFCRLSEAYNQNDLAKVSAIYENVKKGIFTGLSASLSKVQKLHEAIVRCREKVTDLTRTTWELRNSEIYKRVSAIDDFDKHFAELRKQLEGELQALERER